MLNVASLRPSDIERLQSTKLSDEDKKDVLNGLRDMFASVRADGGADSDRIYMAAQMLAMAEVWSQIPAEDVASALAVVDHATRAAFVEGLPHQYAAEVSLLLVTKAVSGSGSSYVVLSKPISRDHLVLADVLSRVRAGVSRSDHVTWGRLDNQLALVERELLARNLIKYEPEPVKPRGTSDVVVAYPASIFDL